MPISKATVPMTAQVSANRTSPVRGHTNQSAAVAITHSDGKIDLIPALPWLAIVVLVELPTQPAVNQLIAHGYAAHASILYAVFASFQMISGLVPGIAGMRLKATEALRSV